MAGARDDCRSFQLAITPQSRWAFTNVASLIPTASIGRGDRGSVAFDILSRTLDGFHLKAGENVSDLAALLNATSTDAIVVLDKGKLVFEFYAENNGPSRPHILMSATKAIAGILCVELAESGALDLRTPIEALVPEVADTPYRGASLRDLMDMRAGVAFDAAQEEDYARAAAWFPKRPGDHSGMHSFLAALRRPGARHGGSFLYTSANTDLLGWAVERATGRAFAELFGTELWSKLGAEHDALVTLDEAGNARWSGGLCLTARDFARLGQRIVEAAADAASPVTRATVADISKGGDRQAWASRAWGAAFAAISSSMSYRNGWYTIDGDPQILFAMGVYGQSVRRSKKSDRHRQTIVLGGADRLPGAGAHSLRGRRDPTTSAGPGAMRRDGLAPVRPVHGWVDVHAHFAPPRSREELETGLAMMRRGCFLATEPYEWTPLRAIDQMDRSGIAMQLLSNIPKALTALQTSNDYGAELVRRHPSRFGLLAAIPTDDPDAGIAEIARAEDLLQADGYAMTCVYNGVTLGDPLQMPIWAALNRRSATVFLHPDAYAGPSLGRPSPLLEVAFETARTVTNMLYAGVFRDYPQITFVVAHCGGALPALAGRLALWRQARVPNPRTITSEEIKAMLATLFFDTAATGAAHSLRPAIEVAGCSHLVYGSDHGVPCSSEATLQANLNALLAFPDLTSDEIQAIGRRGAFLFPSIADRLQEAHATTVVD